MTDKVTYSYLFESFVMSRSLIKNLFYYQNTIINHGTLQCLVLRILLAVQHLAAIFYRLIVAAQVIATLK